MTHDKLACHCVYLFHWNPWFPSFTSFALNWVTLLPFVRKHGVLQRIRRRAIARAHFSIIALRCMLLPVSRPPRILSQRLLLLQRRLLRRSGAVMLSATGRLHDVKKRGGGDAVVGGPQAAATRLELLCLLTCQLPVSSFLDIYLVQQERICLFFQSCNRRQAVAAVPFLERLLDGALRHDIVCGISGSARHEPPQQQGWGRVVLEDRSRARLGGGARIPSYDQKVTRGQCRLLPVHVEVVAVT